MKARIKPNSNLLPPTTTAFFWLADTTVTTTTTNCCLEVNDVEAPLDDPLPSFLSLTPILWHPQQDISFLLLMASNQLGESSEHRGRRWTSCACNGPRERRRPLGTPVGRGDGRDMREPGGRRWECERDRRRRGSGSWTQHVEQQAECALEGGGSESVAGFLYGEL